MALKLLAKILQYHLVYIVSYEEKKSVNLVVIKNKYFWLFFAKIYKTITSSEISPTICNNCVFILCNGFTLHVSGDNLTHHQEYISICTPDDG